MGREGEAIQMFRECMKNMMDVLYVGYSNKKISAITAEYIASFLAEGRVDEATEEYIEIKTMLAGALNFFYC